MRCVKCGGEIKVGQTVEIVTTDDPDERRIFLDSELLVSHVAGECE